MYSHTPAAEDVDKRSRKYTTVKKDREIEAWLKLSRC